MLNVLKLIEPNRVAIYLTVTADVLALLLLVFAEDIQAPAVAGVLTTVAAINAKCIVFLKGWQNLEKADYQAQLLNKQAELQAEAAAAVSRPGGRSPINLPR